MATYRIQYTHGDLRHMWAGDFKSEEDAKDWWESWVAAERNGEVPSDGVLKRDDGAEWVTVTSLDEPQA